MSGATPTQVGSTRTRTRFWCIPQALRQSLDALGVEVDQRTITEDDLANPGQYDLVILGLISPGGLVGHYVNQMLAMLGVWQRERFPMVVCQDDWQMAVTMANLKFLIDRPDRLDRKTEGLGLAGGVDFVERYREDIVRGIHLGHAGDWPPFLLQRFPWGDPYVMLDQARVPLGSTFFSLDPSPLFPKYPASPPDERVLAWSCARLQKRYDKWLDDAEKAAGWPVHRLGAKRLGEQVIPEDQVPQWISERAGTLGPTSMAPGSGMWRSRLQMAAATLTPMVMDPAEAAGLGDPYQVGVADVEAMTDAQREALAVGQRLDLEGRLWSKERLLTEVAAVLAMTAGKVPVYTLSEAAARVLAPTPTPPPPEATPAPGSARAKPGLAIANTAASLMSTPTPSTLQPRRVKAERPQVVRPATEYAAMDFRDTDRILDVGAHRGEFALFVRARCKSAQLLCYEPDLDNYEALQKTLADSGDDTTLTCRAALTGMMVETTLILWQSNGQDTSMHSLIQRRGRAGVEVPHEHIGTAFEKLAPTVVKLAVEGYEHHLVAAMIPYLGKVRQIAIKFHPSTDESRVIAKGVHSHLLDEGYTCVKEPQLDKGSWPVVGVYRREG